MKSHNFPYIDRVLQQALENGSTPGAVLLVDRKDELLYRNAVGYAQIYPEHRAITEETIFDVASLTKVMATTAAVMLLLRDGRISLHDPIHKYVPDFPSTHVTLTHLLTHSAGFPDHVPFYESVQQEAQKHSEEYIGSPEAKQLVIKKVCETEPIYEPGQYTKYSDLDFMLLGHLIESVSGMSLDTFCDEVIFQPFGLTHTFFQPLGKKIHEGEYAATERCEWRQTIMCGRVHDENAYAMGGVAGHAGLFSTIDDIHHFMVKLHKCYMGNDDTIPQKIVKQFFTRQNLVQGSSRALGWDTPSRNQKEKASGGTLLSEKSVGHTGFTGTSIWLDLKRKLLIVLLSNRIHPSRHNHTFLNMRPKIHDTVVIAADNLLDKSV
jgi:CubicO group peptidase (beta-lactamase class C family)